MSFAATWMELEAIILREMKKARHRKTSTAFSYLYMGAKKFDLMDIENRMIDTSN